MGNTPNKRELLRGIPMDFGTEVPQKYEQLLCLPSVTSPQGKEAFKFTGFFFFPVFAVSHKRLPGLIQRKNLLTPHHQATKEYPGIWSSSKSSTAFKN